MSTSPLVSTLTSSSTLLEVDRLSVCYGGVHAVEGITLRVGCGEAVYLLGRNGAGKTSTLRAIVSLVPMARGSVVLAGRDITKLRTDEVARRGVAFVPSGRRAFSGLTVRENLELAQRAYKRAGVGVMTLDETYAMFPKLGNIERRLAGVISGGEQQMLKMARSLMGSSNTLFLLDEPSEGLAPVIVRELVELVAGLIAEGRGVLITEQRRDFIDALPGRVYEIERGVLRGSDLGRE